MSLGKLSAAIAAAALTIAPVAAQAAPAQRAAAPAKEANEFAGLGGDLLIFVVIAAIVALWAVLDSNDNNSVSK